MLTLTIEQLRNMPISMSIIKQIKTDFGMPLKAFGRTRFGIECDSITVVYPTIPRESFYKHFNHLRTSEMIDDDESCDACITVVVDSEDKVSKYETDITEVFKEV